MRCLYEWWGSKPQDLDEADRASRVAMELAPDLADAQLARGYTLSNLRRYEDARKHFEAAARINPNLFDAYYYYARAAFAAGDMEKSIELWRKAGDVRREDFESPLLQALSLRKLGHIEEARESSIRRRCDGPNTCSRSILPMAAYCLSAPACSTKTARLDRAMEWARRAEQLYPDDMGVIINGACVRARSGMKEEAMDLLERMFSKGWGKKDWVENDPDYDSLRAEPRFIAMMAKLK